MSSRPSLKAGSMLPALPPFDEHGLLPVGDYELTLDELEESFLVVGPGGGQPWSEKTRKMLVRNLRVLVEQLWQVGIENTYINGSFVEDKSRPNDTDGYFECNLMSLATGGLQRDLNELDPQKCCTWNQAPRRPDSTSAKLQLPMWHFYRVELYPLAQARMTSSGIRDEHGNELQFPAAFRRQREAGRAKRIIKGIRERRR